MEKYKKIAVSLLIPAIVITLMCLLIIKPDDDMSMAERRKLHKAPKFSVENILDKRYFPKYEDYLLDQFPFRDAMRTLKTQSELHMLLKKDNDGIFYLGEHIFKLDKALDEKQIDLAAKKINGIIAAHPEAKAFYTAVIPDKNYFLKDYPKLDCKEIENIISQKIQQVSAIDIASSLDLNDYYKTDPHFSQSKVDGVAKTICERINGAYYGLKDPKMERIPNFKGAFYGQLALNMPGENLEYITSPSLEGVSVKGVDNRSVIQIYNKDNFNHVDPYDVFLGGAQPLLFIDNPNAKTDETLIIFRDSFASSLTPLLINNYKKIILIDIRYMRSQKADEFVDFTDANVLFLYSSRLWNSGGVLK